MSTQTNPRSIATDLIRSAASDIDTLAISEHLEEHDVNDPDGGITEQVDELLRKATVLVGWPATEPSEPTDGIDLDAIEARANAATPGPWGVGNDTHIVRGLEVTGRGSFTCIQSVAEIDDEDDRMDWDRDEAVEVDPEDDAAFIAAARTDVPALVAEVRRLREQVESFTALLNQTQDQLGETREQLYAQKPVIDAAQAWGEMRETDDVTPTEARHLAGKLSDAVEQYRLMDLALTTARAEHRPDIAVPA